MNKKILSACLLSAGALAAIPCFVAENSPYFKSVAWTGSSLLNFLEHGALAAAGTPPPPTTDTCFTAFQAVIDGTPKGNVYTNGVLDHLHSQLYRMNKVETADVELIFCRLVNVMGFNPDLANLPQTLTKTDPLGGSVTATVTAPTEAFATTAGYIAKAVLAYTASGSTTSTTFLTLWWTGAGAVSKGYLIEGANPMQTDGNTRLRYMQWDLTTSAQTIKFLGTQFATTYLGSATGAANTKTGGDQAIFARMSYDSTTKAITAQAVEIRAPSTTFKCIRTYFTGVMGGTISGYRPAVGTPEGVTETATGGAGVTFPSGGMDGDVSVLDSKATADHAGSPSPGSAVPVGTFDRSCNDMNSAATAGTFAPFVGSTVNFGAIPLSVFPK